MTRYSLAPLRLTVGIYALSLCMMSSLLAADIHVSPMGNDTNAGTAGEPFASFERARTEIRTLKSGPGLPEGGVNVWLHEGVYQRTNTFELGSADAGTPQAPITWRGMPGEQARVVGAVRLDPSWFSVVSNSSPVWGRIDTNARGHVMEVDLLAHGITNYGTLRVRGFMPSVVGALDLFFTNAPMPLARYPDPDEDDFAQSVTNSQLTIFGNPGPHDVTGLYVTNGVSDGVNKFTRVGLVDGKQYNLYRYHWQYPAVTGSWHRAWFLTTSTDGYPPASAPWWSRYSEELGTMNPSPASGSTGQPSSNDPERISHGWLSTDTVVSTTAFTYKGTRPERWTQAEEPWFHGFWYYLWADYHEKSVSIVTNTQTITLSQAPNYGIRAGQPFYALNLLEEITRPGEWYLRRSTGKLYFWPPAPIAGADIYVSMLEEPLWRLKDTTDVVVRDIILDMGRADLAGLEGGSRNAFIHCTLRNAGGYACQVSGMSNGVSSCTILHIGEGGVVLSGSAASRASLVPVCNFARNNDVRDVGRWVWMYRPAVRIKRDAVGCLVSHNAMHDSPHTAILFGPGNDNMIEYNKISDVCKWSSDAGAIYIGRDWGGRGNVIRYNFVYQVNSLFEGHGTHGIYLDDCQSGIRIFGNVLYEISDNAIMMGGGRDNIMENNVVARCGTGIAADARGKGWMFDNGGSSNLWSSLQSLPYQNTLWTNAYPLCAAIPSDWPTVKNGLWLYPEDCLFSRNIGFTNSTWMHTGDNAFVHFKEITNNIADNDPLFVDEGSLDLTLKTNSPAFSIPGFQPIPFDKIGLESNKILSVTTQGGGSVQTTPLQSDYYPMQFVCLTAVTPSLWKFDSWSGAVVGTSDTINVWMTNDLAVTAVFQPIVAENDTPLWWLDRYGLATNDAGALADSDGDTIFNWQEYIAGTDPTNGNSRFDIQSVSTDGGGVTVTFLGASNRFYDLEYSDNLLDTNDWHLLTNRHAFGDNVLEMVDVFDVINRYYRIKVSLLQ